MTTDMNDPTSNGLGRPGRRSSTSWLRRSRRGGLAFGLGPLLALGTSIGLLVAATGSGAQAELSHHHAGGTSHGHARSTLVASLRAYQATQFNAPAADFGGRHHHGGGGSGPTSPTNPPPATPTPPPAQPPAQPPTTPAGPYPVGVADAAEPSGMSPPAGDALPGYTQSYVSDFSGSSLPSGWEVFTGNPGGDPGAQWGAAHVTVSGGLLNLNTWKDPAYNNEWVAGGLCQCGVAHTYGAYFVRSRVTGPGPTQVELLWPTGNRWPPEIDFNESGGTTASTSATLHFGSNNGQDQRKLSIDLTQWHTWGVIWTPSSVTYTVDGKVWGSVSVASEISNVPMTLDLTQQTWCASGWACPTAPQSMQVDWVDEYTS
jgi:glycosyl hydrolase family 16